MGRVIVSGMTTSIPIRLLRRLGLTSMLLGVAAVCSAQSILPGNFLPNPDMETETRFVAHQTEGPTDNSFADYWHHSFFSGWNDLTPPANWPPAPFDLGGTVTGEPVLSGDHSLRLFDQESYYFAPGNAGAGLFVQEEFRTFATEIPLDASSPTGRAEKLWVRWHWNYDMTSGFVPDVTFNFRTSEAPVISLDLTGGFDHKTTASGSSNGLWEEVTIEIDVFPGEQSFDIIVLTEGTDDAIGLMWVDDVSVSTIDPNSLADYNGNGIVDAADYTVWRDTFGSTTNLAADGNNNGVIDQTDYDHWEAQFGLLSSPSSTVPEPASWMLCLVGIGLVHKIQRHRG